jgi:hypothetical protein
MKLILTRPHGIYVDVIRAIARRLASAARRRYDDVPNEGATLGGAPRGTCRSSDNCVCHIGHMEVLMADNLSATVGVVQTGVTLQTANSCTS